MAKNNYQNKKCNKSSYGNDMEQKINIQNTTIREYLDVIIKEYEFERNKRQSFESRSGIIITILAAISIFVFDKISVSYIFVLIKQSLNFIILLKILFGFSVYINFIVTMCLIIKTINIKRYNNLDVSKIDEGVIGANPTSGIIRLIKNYRGIILQHREINDKNAKALRKAFYSVLLMILSMVIYINI